MSNIKQVLCLAFISLRLNLLLMLLLLIAPNLLPVESLFGNHRITAERYFSLSGGFFQKCFDRLFCRNLIRGIHNTRVSGSRHKAKP